MTIHRLMPNSVCLYSISAMRLPSPVSRIGSTSSARMSSLRSEMSDSHHFVRQKREPLIVSKCSCLISSLEPSSQAGKLLSMILQQERHFFQLAVEEQLHELTLERDRASDACNKLNSVSPGFSLHERIEDMKEKERQIAVEDIMYLSIVYNFSENFIPMIPKLSACITNNIIQIKPLKHRVLDSIHGLEVQEMMKEHIVSSIQMREKHDEIDGVPTTKVDRLHLGRSYASSVMYGYFLKSACHRREYDCSVTEDHPKLRNYVEGLDSRSFQRCVKIKSKETVNVIERHIWAVFGESTGQVEGDKEVVLTFPTMKRILLEAVNFGYFLWDVERSIDSIYGLTSN